MPLRTHPLPLISFLCSPHLPHPHQPIYTSISTFPLTCSDPASASPLLYYFPSSYISSPDQPLSTLVFLFVYLALLSSHQPPPLPLMAFITPASLHLSHSLLTSCLHFSSPLLDCSSPPLFLIPYHLPYSYHYSDTLPLSSLCPSLNLPLHSELHTNLNLFSNLPLTLTHPPSLIPFPLSLKSCSHHLPPFTHLSSSHSPLTCLAYLLPNIPLCLPHPTPLISALLYLPSPCPHLHPCTYSFSPHPSATPSPLPHQFPISRNGPYIRGHPVVFFHIEFQTCLIYSKNRFDYNVHFS